MILISTHGSGSGTAKLKLEDQSPKFVEPMSKFYLSLNEGGRCVLNRAPHRFASAPPYHHPFR